MIRYSRSLDGVTPADLRDFFVGWPVAPSATRHLAALSGSLHVVLAFDGDRVVGFVNAVGDGTLTAFVPWLEVLPSHQGRGIGTELMRRVLAALRDVYSVDLVCDAELRPFYASLGLQPLQGMGLRNRAALRDSLQ